MFLIRLIYLKNIKDNSKIAIERNDIKKGTEEIVLSSSKDSDDLFGVKGKTQTIGQIKNIAQEKDVKPKENKELSTQPNLITSFDSLLEICSLKKEIKLKYELEKNVNLVSFENQRIEISFNEDLDKEFIKDLSTKLYEWTGSRWIITLSKNKGEPSKKEKETNKKKDLIEESKNSLIYKNIMEKFPDAELLDVKTLEQNNEND